MIRRLILAAALLFWAALAGAQTLSTAQRTALLADIQANADLLAHYNNGNLDGLAGLYNAQAAPAWTVWRTSVPQSEVMLNGFDWTRVDNLSAGKARIWEWMFDNPTKSFDCSKPNVRAGIDATWVGTAADLAVRAAVYVHCKRTATRFEKLFSAGTGSNDTPATLGTDAAGNTIQGPAPYQLFQGL